MLISVFFAVVAVGCGNLTQVDGISTSKIQTDNTTIVDIANDEYSMLHKGRIYYSYSSGFFSMNIDGSDNQVLNENVFARHMHITDEKTYFVNSNYYGYVFSMNTDGTSLQQLNNDSVSKIFLVNGWIYYNISRNSGNRYGDDGMGIYKMRTDGSELQLVTDDEVSGFIVRGDTIFYTTWDGIFSIDIHGSNRQQLNNTFAWSINMIDDWIVYVDSTNENIQRIDGNGSNEQQLVNDEVRSIHIVEDRIFFKNETDGEIYSINPDGSDRRHLSGDNEAAWVKIFGGPVFGGHESISIFIYKT